MQPIDFLYRGLSRTPSAIAAEDEVTAVSYRELVTRVEALGAAFQTWAPSPGARVGICAYNTLEHLTALLATYAAGHVWVPLNPRNGRAELDALIAATRPALIVADESCLAKFSPPGVPLVLGKTAGPTAARDSVQGLIAHYRGRTPRRHTPPLETEQIIKQTGGSTGGPKAVVQSRRCLNTQAASILHAFEYGPRDCNLIAAPITHASSCWVLPVLAAGGRHVLLEQATPATILDAFAHRGVTTTFLPPTLIHLLMAEPGVRDLSFPALRHLIYSAAPMPPEKISAARGVFGDVLETCYGQVEAPQIITALRAREYAEDRHLASVGRATLLTRVDLMAPDGTLLPPGEVGEVVVRGDLVMNGYLDQPELTAQTIVDGWLHTGDAGVLDERGYLYLKSRIREVIITGGFNVYPGDVEAALSRHPAVYECSVFGVDDEKWGEAVHAAVRLQPGSRATEAELVSFVKANLDSVKAPKRIHLVEDLPRNPVGKVVRRKVREQVLGRADGSDGSSQGNG